MKDESCVASFCTKRGKFSNLSHSLVRLAGILIWEILAIFQSSEPGHFSFFSLNLLRKLFLSDEKKIDRVSIWDSPDSCSGNVSSNNFFKFHLISLFFQSSFAISLFCKPFFFQSVFAKKNKPKWILTVASQVLHRDNLHSFCLQ